MTRDPQFTDGTPCSFDLFTSDLDRAIEFYGGLFGWEADQVGEELCDYTNFRLDGAIVCGAMANDGSAGVGDAFTVYLSVPDADAAFDAAVAAGADVHCSVMAIAELGRMAAFTDPAGAAFAIWEPGTHPGFEVRDEPGAPNWFELFTRDHAAATTFYRDVFGWDLQAVGDSDEFRYSVLRDGGTELAGIMDAGAWLPADVPAHWSVYLQVEDTPATATAAEKLGATVVDGPADTPYGNLATIADPTGAIFKLRQS